MSESQHQTDTERVKAYLKRRSDAQQREINKIITEKATELTDRLELMAMGIKP